MTRDRSRNSSCEKEMPATQETPQPGIMTGLIWDKPSEPLGLQAATATKKQEWARGPEAVILNQSRVKMRGGTGPLLRCWWNVN